MNLFVCGLRRSGTTILYDALREDPDLTCFYEPLREDEPTIGGGSGARDEDAFAGRVRELLIDPGRRHAMGTAAARFVSSERGVGVAAKRLADMLARVMSQAAPQITRAL